MSQRAHDGVHRNEHDERAIWRIRIQDTELGRMRLTDIQPIHVSRWVKSQVAMKSAKTGRGFARQTIANCFNALRVCLRDAVEEGLIQSNPARDVRVPKVPRHSEPWTWLTLDEIDRLLATYKPGGPRNTIVFALFGGMRAGEIFGLRWEDVDFDNNVVIVRRSFNGPTKNGKVRRVPMLAPMREALLSQRELLRATRGDNLVFPSRHGGLHKKGYNANITRHVKMARIGRRVRLHDCRHSFASHLVQGSWGRVWTLQEVAHVLGHSGIVITTRYAHLCAGGIARAAMETNDFRRTQRG